MVEVTATSLILVTFWGLMAVALRLRLLFDLDFAMMLVLVVRGFSFPVRLARGLGPWMFEDFVLRGGKVSSPRLGGLWVMPSPATNITANGS